MEFCSVGFLWCLEIPCCNGTKWGGSGGSDDPAIGRRRRSSLAKLLIGYISLVTGEIINPWTGGKLSISEENDENSAQEGKFDFIYYFTLQKPPYFCLFFKKSFNFYFFGPIICVSLLKILFFVVVFVHCLKHNYFFWCLIWDSGLKVETRVHYNNLFFMIYLLQFLKSLIQWFCFLLFLKTKYLLKL